MRRQRYLSVCLIVCTFGGLRGDSPESAAVSLRIDGVHEILTGTLADPFHIKLSPDGTLTAGQPVYVRADFKPLGVLKKVQARDRRKVREVLEADRIVIDVQFPHVDPNGKPLTVQGWLRPDFCCGKGLDGTFPIPDQARRGEITLRISWPTSGSLKAGSTRVEVILGPGADPKPK